MSPQGNQALESRVGTIIRDRFRIEKMLGEGGMGAVYLADHWAIGRKVAIKLIHGQFANDEEYQRRFRDDAIQAAKVTDARVVTIYDSGRTEDGILFIVMEYVEGRTLREVIPRGGLPVAKAVHLASELARALQAVHQARIIHRDVKPENVVVDDRLEKIKLLDFGVARPTERAAGERKTGVGLVVGTPGYVCPEQIQKGIVTHQADLYAWAVVLYEMLSGELPYQAETDTMLMLKQVSERARPIRSLRSDVPAELESFLSECLQHDPERRPRDMGEILKRLARWSGATPKGATIIVETPSAASPAPAARGSRAPVVLSSLVAVVASLAAIVQWVNPANPPGVPATVQGEITQLSAAVDRAKAELADIKQRNASLVDLKNGKFCVRNKTDVKSTIAWLAVTYRSADGSRFETFNSAFSGYPTWALGGGERSNPYFERGGRTLWDGSVVFYAMEVKRGEDTFNLAGPWSLVSDGCLELK